MNYWCEKCFSRNACVGLVNHTCTVIYSPLAHHCFSPIEKSECFDIGLSHFAHLHYKITKKGLCSLTFSVGKRKETITVPRFLFRVE